jgi:hypothetical protein
MEDSLSVHEWSLADGPVPGGRAPCGAGLVEGGAVAVADAGCAHGRAAPGSRHRLVHGLLPTGPAAVAGDLRGHLVAMVAGDLDGVVVVRVVGVVVAAVLPEAPSPVVGARGQVTEGRTQGRSKGRAMAEQGRRKTERDDGECRMRRQQRHPPKQPAPCYE